MKKNILVVNLQLLSSMLGSSLEKLDVDRADVVAEHPPIEKLYLSKPYDPKRERLEAERNWAKIAKRRTCKK